ncbi:uncharacterized protein LOC109609622 [Aethina tumida]|uniref:uncharacterized protein LOC109609622 n=1 Tax=Aethina tumida TaxID=116153 RepID=UPI00096B61BF|nr:uncharacterized protein LOC109609622 [Aethina tumida]
MSVKYDFVILMLCLSLQIIWVSGDDDNAAKLKSCKDKIFKQIDNFKLDKAHSCLSADKLKILNDNLNKYKNITAEVKKTLPAECKLGKNMADCLRKFADVLQTKGRSISEDFVGSLRTIVDASQGCVTPIMEKMKGLDKYVLSGCP